MLLPACCHLLMLLWIQVMLLSLRAGGVGLNLIGGCNLFLLDMHWYLSRLYKDCSYKAATGWLPMLVCVVVLKIPVLAVSLHITPGTCWELPISSPLLDKYIHAPYCHRCGKRGGHWLTVWQIFYTSIRPFRLVMTWCHFNSLPVRKVVFFSFATVFDFTFSDGLTHWQLARLT